MSGPQKSIVILTLGLAFGILGGGSARLLLVHAARHASQHEPLRQPGLAAAEHPESRFGHQRHDRLYQRRGSPPDRHYRSAAAHDAVWLRRRLAQNEHHQRRAAHEYMRPPKKEIISYLSDQAGSCRSVLERLVTASETL